MNCVPPRKLFVTDELNILKIDATPVSRSNLKKQFITICQ